jgi:L-alanine-DL-glutamate epimerase-like enolase superfamily enzyme
VGAGRDILPVSGIDVLLRSFALPHPVRFGSAVIRSRDHVVVRVRADGTDAVGYAAGYARGTPLLEAVRLLAPAVLGADAMAPSAAVGSLASSNRAGHAALVRAVSLLDLALWDLAANHREAPLFELLGGTRRAVPALIACGYFIDERGEDAVLDELLRYEAEGHRFLKLMLGARPTGWMCTFLSRAKALLSAETRLAVDLHYSVGSLDAGVQLLNALADLGLAFVEDPFDPPRWRDLAELRERVATPIAAGEDVVSPLQYRDLLDAVSILRVDPSSCGGLSDALDGARLARERGVPVLPHGHAGLNAQLAAACPEVMAVEVVPPSASADGFAAYCRSSLVLGDGMAQLDDVPGAGLVVDWDGLVALPGAAWATA